MVSVGLVRRCRLLGRPALQPHEVIDVLNRGEAGGWEYRFDFPDHPDRHTWLIPATDDRYGWIFTVGESGAMLDESPVPMREAAEKYALTIARKGVSASLTMNKPETTETV